MGVNQISTVIANDFANLRNVGIESPLMAEFEAAIKPPTPSAKPLVYEWRDSHGKACHKGDPDCQYCPKSQSLCV